MRKLVNPETSFSGQASTAADLYRGKLSSFFTSSGICEMFVVSYLLT